MRNAVATIIPLVLILSALPLGAASHEVASDPQAIAELEARANQADPRERCFLYAQLIYNITELSVKKFAAGQVEAAAGLLRQVQSTAKKIHHGKDTRDKKLKNAEILLNQSSFRLNELLRSNGYADRELVEQTLADVNHAQNETMMRLFEK